nr:DUF2851 family protein [Marivirga aurantiaca]
MQEDFLHYIWRYQKFASTDLQTVEGVPIHVIKTGFAHTNAGPDFQQAKVKIGEMEWAGAVEIHIKASDWNRHYHQSDPNYQNVVLHVVWQADEAILHPDGTAIPTLELKDKVDLSLIDSYKKLVQSSDEIACAQHWEDIGDVYKSEMLERVLVERLNDKSEKARKYFNEVKQDWEEVSYFMLLSAMGFKVNQHPFERLATVLPYSFVKKIKHHPELLEAVVFGASGFLEQEFIDDYPNQLKKDWKFLRHKHSSILQDTMQQHEWRFLRLRPTNFPTVRLAQLAQLLHQLPSLFDAFVLEMNTKELMKNFRVTPHEYWENHFQFDVESPRKSKKLGRSSVDILLMNTVPPLLAFYAKGVGEERYVDQAIQLMNTLKAEKNFISRKFESLGMKISTASDSQALIQLHNAYCQPKKCLSCSVGLSILK